MYLTTFLFTVHPDNSGNMTPPHKGCNFDMCSYTLADVKITIKCIKHLFDETENPDLHRNKLSNFCNKN